jgi:two-component system response regulator FlrC
VLITGEIGSGRKTLGTFIHSESARKSAACRVVDCSLDTAHVERDVLGFRDDESGRFHRGALEECNGGTVIFADVDALDEIFQKRLYTILQELPDYELDVRIVATTSKNLSKLVGAGKFSRTLLTYFSGAQISVVPLRERGTDVEDLANYFVQVFSAAQGLTTPTITPEALQRLVSNSWSHNISELKSLIQSAVTNSKEGLIDLAAFEQQERKSDMHAIEVDEEGFKLMSLREAEKLLIKKALVFTAENRTQAAKILFKSIASSGKILE